MIIRRGKPSVTKSNEFIPLWKTVNPADENVSAPELPVGTYTCRIDKFRQQDSKDSIEKLQTVTQFVCVSGEFQNCKISKWHRVEEEIGIAYFKRWILVLGFDIPEEFTDFKDFCEKIEEMEVALKDVPVNIQVWENKNGYKDVSIIGFPDEEEHEEKSVSKNKEKTKEKVDLGVHHYDHHGKVEVTKGVRPSKPMKRKSLLDEIEFDDDDI